MKICNHKHPFGEENCADCKISKLQDKIEKAKELIVRYGNIDGGHHKMWVLDQVFRELCGDTYEKEVAEACDGEDGPNTYSWDEGIAP